jgi:hypothetical protein
LSCSLFQDVCVKAIRLYVVVSSIDTPLRVRFGILSKSVTFLFYVSISSNSK